MAGWSGPSQGREQWEGCGGDIEELELEWNQPAMEQVPPMPLLGGQQKHQ